MEKEILYNKIYLYLLEKIENGILKQGAKIPSEKELSLQFNVSRITSKKALEMLCEKGYISRYPGKGSFVNNIIARNKNTKQNDVEKRLITSEKNTHEANNIVGVIVPEFSSVFASDIISAIEYNADKEGFLIIPKRSYGSQVIEEEAINRIISAGAKGIIIMPVHGEYYNKKIIQLILDGYPVVVIDRKLMGIEAPFVTSNNWEASTEIVNTLIENGHKNIAFISAAEINTSSIQERFIGYIKSHEENNIRYNTKYWLQNIKSVLPGEYSRKLEDEEVENIRLILKKYPEITAVFANEYEVARLVEKALIQLNKKIPEDISLVCYDSSNGLNGQTDFTHVKQNEYEIGCSAFQILKDIINDKKDIHGIEIRIPAEIVERGTVKNINEKNE